MEDVHAVLDAAGSERAAVFAISEGGPMAIPLAATQPDRVSHLIVYGTYARFTRSDDYPQGYPDTIFEDWNRMVRDEWHEAPGLSLLAPSLLGDDDAARAWGRFIRAGTSPRGATALLELYREIDVREALPLVSQPTLILHREDDEAVRPPMARQLAERIPDARYVEVPGGTMRSSSAIPTP